MTRRISAEEYRARSLDDWCAAVLQLGAVSLTDWAEKSRTSYNAARLLGVHRAVAERQGWDSKLPNGALDLMSDDEYAALFRDRGAKTASDLWAINNAWCRLLSRQGRLTHVRDLVGATYSNERHASDAEYYIERCRQFDFYEAWLCADRTAAATARRHGVLAAVKAAVKHRPFRFGTSGGLVRSVSELVLARLLERSGCEFLCEPDYPFMTPGRHYHPMAADFLLPGGWWVEVWALPPDAIPRRDADYRYLSRRREKVALCRKHRLRLISVEGHLLHRASLQLYVRHCAIALKAAADLVVGDVEPRHLLSL